jgi:hypothetical protein
MTVHYIIRCGDGANLRNSVNPYWGVKRTGGQDTFVKKIKPGDILWFMTSKKFGGQLIGMAEYTMFCDRSEETLIQLYSFSNSEQGWVGDENWDIQIHYKHLYNTEMLDIRGCVACAANILKYETFTQNISKNLFDCYEQIKNPYEYLPESLHLETPTAKSPATQPKRRQDKVFTMCSPAERVDMIHQIDSGMIESECKSGKKQRWWSNKHYPNRDIPTNIYFLGMGTIKALYDKYQKECAPIEWKEFNNYTRELKKQGILFQISK